MNGVTNTSQETPKVTHPRGRALSEETKFIRTQGLGVPIETVISRGVVKGLTITNQQVWKARAVMRKKDKPATVKKQRVSKKMKQAAFIAQATERDRQRAEKPVEHQVTHEFLKLLASEIGLSRAIEIIQEMKDRLQVLIQGGS